jgi:hypothetical protein
MRIQYHGIESYVTNWIEYVGGEKVITLYIPLQLSRRSLQTSATEFT